MTFEEVRKLWVSALRSGDYKQGHRRLCTYETDEFCCLGVLADLYCKHVKDIREVATKGNRRYVRYGESAAFLPKKVREWAGLSSTQGTYHLGSLVALNDNINYSFKEIADTIESQPTGLFVDDTLPASQE